MSGSSCFWRLNICMSQKRFLLDASGNTIKEIIVPDAETMITVTTANVQGALDFVKSRKDAVRTDTNYREVAYFPPCIVEKSVMEGWLHDKAKWTEMLNDADYKAFRIWEGRVSGHEGGR